LKEAPAAGRPARSLDRSSSTNSAPLPAADAASVFVSIASYRDPQLAPTVRDCLEKARHPERLRFAICWQHGEEEVLPPSFGGDQFSILDVDWRESRGACWARAEIMGLWRGEDWYLQLDSHHRFAENWDVRLLEQAALTGSDRPILSAFPPYFTLDGDAASKPLLTAYGRFDEDGIALPAGKAFPNWRPGLPPRRTRFLSAAFLLAPGSFVEDVPYDPQLYFHGEETVLTLRAFSHGYELFQPCELLLWHEYTRAYRVKHWDDHVLERGVEVGWGERDARSRERITRFLAEPYVGRLGLGGERTLADYEAYAGISFKHRRVQDYTRRGLEPPNPPSDPDWATRPQDRRVRVELDLAKLPEAAVEDPDFWYVGVHDEDGRELYRRDVANGELEQLLASGADSVVLERRFESEAEPASVTVIPHSASCGWLEPLTQDV
jgi:Glycosyltransferase (GlcNAc)